MYICILFLMDKRIILLGLLIVLMGCESSDIEEEIRSDVGEEIQNVNTFSRLPKADVQIDFVNEHYDYVMTASLNNEVREKVNGPKLLLYRSIQGAWGDRHWDWEYVDSNEEMFEHGDGKRIKTIWDSWLMKRKGLWVEYYGVTAANQIYDFDYDGLFIDSATHKLWAGSLDNMPDGYSDEVWKENTYSALDFVKSNLIDKTVVFNGLHEENGAEKSLDVVDGGMWEVFAFRRGENYVGEETLKGVLDLVNKNKNKVIILVSKKKGLTLDVDARMFVLSSYLLVSDDNVVLAMEDLDYNTLNVFYYPEYEVDLGNPLGDYYVEGDIYLRDFEKGKVLVNLDSENSYFYSLDENYEKVVPVGGGVLKKDGTTDGFLDYGPVVDGVEISPIGGIVLIFSKEN